MATEGMDISTSTDTIEDLRRLVLDLILSDHPQDCMTCEKAGNCTLQDLAYAYGIREPEYPGERREYATRDGNPFIERDLEKCILCGRCVKACEEIQGVEAIDFGYRGFKSKICTIFEEDLDCEFCGQCVAVCPTGALTGKAWKQQGRTGRLKETDTVCAYCGTGCNITVHTNRNEIVRITSREDTWNEGWLCVKGRFGYRFVSSPDRLRKPLIRKGETFEEASWDEALGLVASRFRDIRARHGADSLAGLSSARCTNEENYLFQKFMRAAVGTNNVDHCARL
jgi:predicted molibdopterin-dependent oxidoreductase YjgC